MQKELTLTELSAKFTKSFETFGKMDPFLIFSVNKNQQKKTETANDAGKEPKWRKVIVLRFLDQTQINVKAFEEDMTTNEFIGEGAIQIKNLKEKGHLQIPVFGEDEEEIGMIYGQYTLKTLAPAPFLIVKNITCNFYKEAKFLLKTKPFVRMSCTADSANFEPKKETDSKQVCWNQSQRIKIKDAHKVEFKMLDSDAQDQQIFSYETNLREFRTLSGVKKYHVHDKKFDPLAVFSFQYETLNFVNKEDSVRNEEKTHLEEGSLSLITIKTIKGDFKEGGNDVYMKILIGPNQIITKEISDAKKKFDMAVSQQLYAEPKENKITFAVFDKDILKDDLLGFGHIGLEGLSSGTKRVELMNNEKKNIGLLQVDLTSQKVKAKKMIITNIYLKTEKSGDFIGQSDNFVVGRVGGWTARTETLTGQEIKFKKSLTLMFSNETTLDFDIFDEDITENEKVLSVEMLMADLQKKKSGEIKVNLTSKSEKKKKGGELHFDFMIEGDKKEEKVPKLATKKSIIVKQQIQKHSQSLDLKRKDKQGENYGRQSQKSKEKYREKTVTQTILQNKSVHESRNIKLPSIFNNRNYGDSIFENASTATLQKSIHAYSMPKAERFPDRAKYNGIEPSYYVESAFKKGTGKGPHIGFGEKKVIPDYLIRNMKEYPAPNTYGTIETKSINKQKGKTFGISREFYEKVLVPKEKVDRRRLEKIDKR